MRNNKAMMIIGIVLIVLALVITIVPQFTTCQAQGKQIDLGGGKSVPMKCYWTGQGELVTGILLLIVGILMIVSKRKETQLFLSILGIVLGIAIVVLPMWLIGTCSTGMLCNTAMKPVLVITGALATIAAILGLVFAVRIKENGA